MAPRERQQDDSENGVDPPHHVHYHQTKNGHTQNTILLTCLIAIVGFVGLQVWLMNGRMSALEAMVELLVQRSGIAIPPQ